MMASASVKKKATRTKTKTIIIAMMTMTSVKKKATVKTKTKKKTFRSKFEQTVAEALDKMKVSYEYEAHRLPYVVERNYLPDFRLPSGACGSEGLLQIC